MRERRTRFEDDFAVEVEQEYQEKRKSASKKGNFYATAEIHAKLNDRESWRLDQVLIDSGATLDLIPERLDSQMNLTQYDDSIVCIHLANGDKQRLAGYARFRCTVAGVSEVIEAYIVPGHTSYSLLMGRAWL